MCVMKDKKFRWMISTAVALACVARGAARADDPPIMPASQADTALHLLEGARYGEAIPATQALVDLAPNDAFSYQLRGTEELYLGGVSAARQDFAAAARLAAGNPVTLYGQGLVDLWEHSWDKSRTELAQAQQTSGLPAAESDDLATAQAYLDFLRGDFTSARVLAQPMIAGNDPVRQELLALIEAHDQPAEGAARLTAFLQTAGGVPRVREDEGLRPRFDPTAPGIEPAVTEPSLQQMYRASLRDSQPREGRQRKATGGLTGLVPLRAPGDLSSATTAVTFTIDGQLAGMINTPPYQYVWNTANGGNGRHSVRIDALDANGDVLSSTTRLVSVANAHPGASDAGLAADPQREVRLWNLLRLRPARKVAEWRLAEILQQQGDAGGAQTHRAIAAALDADYKDGRHAARALFGAGAARLSLTEKADKLQGLRVGSASRKQVALTFDDGPNPQKTPALLDALDKADAPATFFVVGARAEASPDLVRRMVARGDDVENHSYTHPNMAQTAPAIAESEILRTTVVIRALAGKTPRFFRPPGGQRNPVVYRLAGEYGQTVALWTIDALNYEEAGSPEGLTDFVLKHMRPGAIVLMHNGMDSTTAAVPGLVAALRARGYQIVTLTQMTAGAPAVKAAFVPAAKP